MWSAKLLCNGLNVFQSHNHTAPVQVTLERSKRLFRTSNPAIVLLNSDYETDVNNSNFKNHPNFGKTKSTTEKEHVDSVNADRTRDRAVLTSTQHDVYTSTDGMMKRSSHFQQLALNYGHLPTKRVRECVKPCIAFNPFLLLLYIQPTTIPGFFEMKF